MLMKIKNLNGMKTPYQYKNLKGTFQKILSTWIKSRISEKKISRRKLIQTELLNFMEKIITTQTLKIAVVLLSIMTEKEFKIVPY